ncbi:IQ domain-containing protein N [Rhineura floridana]|uniref:IQ domain-containing protein N n=1 Tax=Rhineura floridana TaxID=261503 RepID=UPI002AC86630|nr:IQ domain-containing protein N [Rhineura floridana]
MLSAAGTGISSRALTPAMFLPSLSSRMETYEDHPWCPYSSQSGEEDDDDHPYDPHLARVRARSNSRSSRRSSFLVDELDMLMDKAATTIQATWRGYLTRKRIMHEHAAATTIQAAWRRFITREYVAMQWDQVPSWQVYRQRQQPRRRTPSFASFEDRRRSWGHPDTDREKAAEVIQAHYRGYKTRRALRECKQAATTIQAHWRGYRTRQQLAQRPERPYPRSGPKGTYYGRPSYMPGSFSWVGPYPRKHWHKCLVGDPEEWASKVPRAPPYTRERMEPAQPKTCPRCGRCTSVRVLMGFGKGPPSKSETDDSECEGRVRPPARRKSPASRSRGGQSPARSQPYGAHVSYQTSPRAYYPSTPSAVAEDQPRRQGRDPGGLSQRYATVHMAPRPTRERNTARSLSSTSICQPGPPSAGTSDWHYENYCTRRMGEGQKRVFKTRKQMWQVSRAATLIQSFWRGWKARQALRQQHEAAIRIQSAYRGYKTRLYLTEAGVLSERETE